MGVALQIVCSAMICCMCLCSGIMFAWPSSTLRLFSSTTSTPLHRRMSGTELVLFGSLYPLGALVGTPLVSTMLDTIGRKRNAIIFSSICVVSWTMIACSRAVEVVLTAVFVAGLSGAVFLVAPVYISEICAPSVRGTMSSCTNVFFAIGMLVSYALGGALSYTAMVYVNLGIALAVTAAQVLLKESPTHLLAKQREQEAIQSISFYRRIKPDSKEVQEQMNIIRQSLNPDLDGITVTEETPREEKLNFGAQKQTPQQLGVWKFIKKSSSTRRAFTVTVVLMTTSIFQGMVVLQVYAEPLFVEVLPNMSANLASILLALVAVFIGFIAAHLTDRAGRRPLMIYSSLLTGLSCVLLGLQLQLHWGPSWLVALNIYFFTMMFAFGGGTVPYVLLAEVFLPQVKSILTMLVVEWMWFCNYVILFIFTPLLQAIGLGPCFYIFSAVSLATAAYAARCLPETKALTVYQIQGKFAAHRVGDRYNVQTVSDKENSSV